MSSSSAPTYQSTQASATQKRISKACDACQARKVRCMPVDQISADSTPTCEVCSKKGTDCTFEAERKKRGPVPRSAARSSVRRAPVPILSKRDGESSIGKRKRFDDVEGVMAGPDEGTTVRSAFHPTSTTAQHNTHESSQVSQSRWTSSPRATRREHR